MGNCLLSPQANWIQIVSQPGGQDDKALKYMMQDTVLAFIHSDKAKGFTSALRDSSLSTLHSGLRSEISPSALMSSLMLYESDS